jgi:hypothetical protein
VDRTTMTMTRSLGEPSDPLTSGKNRKYCSILADVTTPAAGHGGDGAI